MDIREEDIDHKTMVFELTSTSLNTKLQVCVGKPYTYSGKDRYNVYEVIHDQVTRPVGYYEVEEGIEVDDDDGDFNIEKFKEPNWTVQESTVAKPKAARVKPPPKKIEADASETETESEPSAFEYVSNKGRGDCFYETIIQSGLNIFADGENHDVKTLRAKIGTFMTTTDKESLIKYYNNSKHAPEKMCQNEYYKKYCEMKKTGASDDDIKRAIKDERKAGTGATKENLSYTYFIENYDANPFMPWNPDDINDVFINTYFNGDHGLKKSEIASVFKRNISKSGVWADEKIFSALQQMIHVKLLLLTHTGENVEDLEAEKDDSFYDIHKDTTYIIVDYTPMTHFQLIQLKNNKQSLFKWAELPDVIKSKFENSTWIKKANELEASVESPESALSEEEDGEEPPEEESEEEESEETPEEDEPVSPELTPLLTPVPSPVAPIAPVAPVAPVVPKPVIRTGPEMPANIDEMTKKELEAFMDTNSAHYPGFRKTFKTVGELRECLRSPVEACYLKGKWVKPSGGNITRKNK